MVNFGFSENGRGGDADIPQIECFACGGVCLQFGRLVNVVKEEYIRQHFDIFRQLAAQFGRIIAKVKHSNVFSQLFIALVVESIAK